MGDLTRNATTAATNTFRWTARQVPTFLYGYGKRKHILDAQGTRQGQGRGLCGNVGMDDARLETDYRIGSDDRTAARYMSAERAKPTCAHCLRIWES